MRKRGEKAKMCSRRHGGRIAWVMPVLCCLPAGAEPGGERPACALVPFHNETGRVESAYVAGVIEQALHGRLQRAGKWQVVERARLQELLAESDLKAADLATGEPSRLRGADLLVVGEYRDDGGLVTVTARLVEAATGEVVGQASWRGHVSGLADEMGARVAAGLAGEPPPADKLGGEMQAVFDKACRYLSRGRADQAIEACTTILAEHPGDVATLLLRGHAELGKKGWGRYAAKDFEKVLEIDEDNIAAKIGLARTKLGGDRRSAEQALQWIEEVLAERPEQAEALLLAARVHEAAGRTEQAVVAAARAVEVLPQYGPAWVTLGRLHLRQDRAAEGLRCARSALECQPSDPVAWMLLGDAQLAGGQREEAEGSFRRALEGDPSPEVKKRLRARLHERQ